MTPSDLLKTLAGAAAGALLAWTGHSFTFDGQLEALTKSMQRIEARLDRLTEARK
jgi:hypothetical protein